MLQSTVSVFSVSVSHESESEGLCEATLSHTLSQLVRQHVDWKLEEGGEEEEGRGGGGGGGERKRMRRRRGEEEGA